MILLRIILSVLNRKYTSNASSAKIIYTKRCHFLYITVVMHMIGTELSAYHLKQLFLKEKQFRLRERFHQRHRFQSNDNSGLTIVSLPCSLTIRIQSYISVAIRKTIYVRLQCVFWGFFLGKLENL